MKVTGLTGCRSAATSLPIMGMTGIQQSGLLRFDWRAVRVMMVGLGLGSVLSGCIQVTAPDKPIVIELNVNIRQEVIYRLAADAESTIEENKDVF